MVTVRQPLPYRENGTATSTDWLRSTAPPILFTGDLTALSSGAHYAIVGSPRVLTEADYPVLGGIWDNEDDSIYDSL